MTVAVNSNLVIVCYKYSNSILVAIKYIQLIIFIATEIISTKLSKILSNNYTGVSLGSEL
jgi:hypothetical protein